MTYRDRALQIAKDNIEWFVTNEEPMTKQESIDFLLRVGAVMFDLGKAEGRSELLQEQLEELRRD